VTTAPERPEDLSAVEIIATVSHELRSPLTSIKGFTSLLLSRWDGISDDRKKEMLEAVRHDADRVTRMLTELLDISRLEAGRLHLSPRPLEIGPLIRSVVDKVAMAEPQLEATIDIAEDVPEVVADGDKVEQVLTNLVENAAKYGSPIGLRVSARLTVDGVAVAVADQGAGIPAEDLDRVFERFYRVDPARSRETGGTGLGLAIVKHIVNNHGGHVRVWSSPGSGSTFTLTLPSPNRVSR